MRAVDKRRLEVFYNGAFYVFTVPSIEIDANWMNNLRFCSTSRGRTPDKTSAGGETMNLADENHPGNTITTSRVLLGRLMSTSNNSNLPPNLRLHLWLILLPRFISSSSSLEGSSVLFNSGGNIFGWDSSSALSEASEVGFMRWLNHVFANGLATPGSLPSRLATSSMKTDDHEPSEARCALGRLLQSAAFAAPAHRIERDVDTRKLVINSDLNFRADKGWL